MSLRFPVTFPNGKTYEIGGIPLCSKDKLSKIAPDLFNATNKLAENSEELEEQAFQIVKFFNPDVEKDDFLVDSYSLNELMLIWSGQKDQKKKD